MTMLATTTSSAVVLPRDLAERLLAGLRARETRRGHLAQKVPHEGLGLCSWRSESPRCVEHHQLVAELSGAVEAHAVTISPQTVTPERRCRACDADLTGRRPQTTTCSSACRQAASRQLRRAAP